MSKHDPNLTISAKAILAAGKHLEHKDSGDPFDLLTKKFGDLTDETLKRIGKTDTKLAEVVETIGEIDQKLARASFGNGSAQPETWGEQFSNAEELKSFASDSGSRPGRFRMQMKTTITSDGASGGALGVTARDNLVMLPRQRLTVRNLLPVVQVSSNAVEYPRQTARPTGAATVAEGALKPESAMTFDLQTVNTQVIAHWIPASRQILDDAPQMRDVIDVELRHGLALAEETQLLNGDGTGSNLTGMIPAATAFVDPLAQGAPNMIDLIGAGILQSALAEFPADGIVMHPADWMRIRLLKDANGEYLLGDPQKIVAPSLFGLPVVPTQAMTVDKFLIGNFQAAGTLYDRWDARVEVSTEHADFFTRNLVAVLAEERLALAIKQSTALTYGDFGNVA